MFDGLGRLIPFVTPALRFLLGGAVAGAAVMGAAVDGPASASAS